MKRTTAITSILSLAAGSLTLSGIVLRMTTERASADQMPANSSVPKRFTPLAITTTDGKKGQVTAQTTNGKTVYYFTLNGKPAAPGTYTCANGHIRVLGPDGLVDPRSFTAGSTIMLNPQPLPP